MPEKRSMSSRAKATVGKHVGWVKGTILAKKAASTPKHSTPRSVATPKFFTARSKRKDETPADLPPAEAAAATTMSYP